MFLVPEPRHGYPYMALLAPLAVFGTSRAKWRALRYFLGGVVAITLAFGLRQAFLLGSESMGARVFQERYQIARSLVFNLQAADSEGCRETYVLNNAAEYGAVADLRRFAKMKGQLTNLTTIDGRIERPPYEPGGGDLAPDVNRLGTAVSIDSKIPSRMRYIMNIPKWDDACSVTRQNMKFDFPEARQGQGLGHRVRVVISHPGPDACLVRYDFSRNQFVTQRL